MATPRFKHMPDIAEGNCGWHVVDGQKIMYCRQQLGKHGSEHLFVPAERGYAPPSQMFEESGGPKGASMMKISKMFPNWFNLQKADAYDQIMGKPASTPKAKKPAVSFSGKDPVGGFHPQGTVGGIPQQTTGMLSKPFPGAVPQEEYKPSFAVPTTNPKSNVPAMPQWVKDKLAEKFGKKPAGTSSVKPEYGPPSTTYDALAAGKVISTTPKKRPGGPSAIPSKQPPISSIQQPSVGGQQPPPWYQVQPQAATTQQPPPWYMGVSPSQIPAQSPSLNQYGWTPPVQPGGERLVQGGLTEREYEGGVKSYHSPDASPNFNSRSAQYHRAKMEELKRYRPKTLDSQIEVLNQINGHLKAAIDHERAVRVGKRRRFGLF